jgi:hypothetical protein
MTGYTLSEFPIWLTPSFHPTSHRSCRLLHHHLYAWKQKEVGIFPIPHRVATTCQSPEPRHGPNQILPQSSQDVYPKAKRIICFPTSSSLNAVHILFASTIKERTKGGKNRGCAINLRHSRQPRQQPQQPISPGVSGLEGEESPGKSYGNACGHFVDSAVCGWPLVRSPELRGSRWPHVVCAGWEAPYHRKTLGAEAAPPFLKHIWVFNVNRF